MKSITLNKVINEIDLLNLEQYCSKNLFYIMQKEEMEVLNIAPIELKEFINKIKESEYFSIFKEMLNNIKSEYLYKSYTHGVYHNERVSLFAFFLATSLGLNKRDIMLSLYASMYHDIGRVNDLLDDSHGKRSADLLGELCLPIDDEELQILKVIIHGHSLSDKVFSNLLDEYQIKDVVRAKILYSILKDSDGLDRTRLRYPYVELKYLRNDMSSKLVLTSYELFEFYDILTKSQIN